MAYFRRIDAKIWGDATFQQLSPLLPSGQALWLYLLTGPHHVGVPGLYHVGRAALAEALSWDIADFDAAFAEIEDNGLALADWERRVVFIPNAIRYEKPNNARVVAGWMRAADAVPECKLRDRWHDEVAEYLREIGRAEWIGEKPVTVDPDNLEAERMAKWSAWQTRLIESAREDGVELVARKYVAEMERAVSLFYEQHGGRFTAHRRAKVAAALSQFKRDAVLLAIEIYVDRHAGSKDERYLCGIARRMSRMSERELAAELKRHRSSVHGGIAEEFTKGATA